MAANRANFHATRGQNHGRARSLLLLSSAADSQCSSRAGSKTGSRSWCWFLQRVSLRPQPASIVIVGPQCHEPSFGCLGTEYVEFKSNKVENVDSNNEERSKNKFQFVFLLLRVLKSLGPPCFQNANWQFDLNGQVALVITI